MKLRVDVAVDSVAAVNLNGVSFQCCGPFNLASCRAIPSYTSGIGTDFQQIFDIDRRATAYVQIACFEAFCNFEMRFGIACSVCR